MRYGAMNFPIRPVLAEIQRLSGLDLDYLELAMDPPEAHHRQLSRQRTAIRSALADAGLGLVCHLPTFVNIADLTPGLRAASLVEVLDSLEVAADLGAERVVLHPGYASGLGRFVVATVHSLALENLPAAIQRAGALGACPWASRTCRRPTGCSTARMNSPPCWNVTPRSN